MNEPAKPLRIFLSYAHADVVAVRKLHRYLREKGFDVWFDKENLVPGHDWQLEIEKSLNNSDVVLICLSQTAVSKEGFVQREFKFALDRMLEMPEGRIFLIPVRLQPCEVPTRLSRYHWVDLFEREGYARLMRGLKLRAEQLARASVDESQPVNIPEQDESLNASISVGQDVSGNVIMGNNNVINIMPSLTAQDEVEKQEKPKKEEERQAREKVEGEERTKEQERHAAEEAENERLKKIKTENEKIANERAEQKSIDQQKDNAKRIADEQVEKTPWDFKIPALIFGGLMLLSLSFLALVILQPPVKPTSTPTPQISDITTLPLTATLTSAPPTKTLIALPTKTLTSLPTDIPAAATPTLAAGGATQVSPIDGMVLHYVPAGSFTMGSDNGEANEKPTHVVTLNAFWIDETEVTNKMYAQCVKDAKCEPPSDKNLANHKAYYDDPLFADYPVIYILWYDATAYCSWAGRTLPSEAQWEKAARGIDGRTYPWGNAAPKKDFLNYNNNVGNTTKVASYPAGSSPYGAYDMAGNVWEWVKDLYSSTYYASSPSSNPLGPATGDYFVLRGGSWGDYSGSVRSTNRYFNPGFRSSNFGFRCALSQ